MKKLRLTRLESRALAWAEETSKRGSASVSVEWIGSRTWGLCPRIMHRGVKIAHASGSGYCKQSTVLADAFKWLFPHDSEGYRAVSQSSGAGVSTVQERMRNHGWEIEHVAFGDKFDAWDIKRIEAPKPEEFGGFVPELPDVGLVVQVCERVELARPDTDRTSLLMDLSAVHQRIPLDFKKLVDAPDADFFHDINGIRRYINRRTGELEDCFLPRCAAEETPFDDDLQGERLEGFDPIEYSHPEV